MERERKRRRRITQRRRERRGLAEIGEGEERPASEGRALQEREDLRGAENTEEREDRRGRKKAQKRKAAKGGTVEIRRLAPDGFGLPGGRGDPWPFGMWACP